MEGPLAATPGHPCSGVPEEAGTSGGEWTSALTRHMAAVRHQQLLQVMVHQAACAASHADKAGVVHKNMWWSSYRQACAAWLRAAAEACWSDAKLPGFSPCSSSGPGQAQLASSLACRAVMIMDHLCSRAAWEGEAAALSAATWSGGQHILVLSSSFAQALHSVTGWHDSLPMVSPDHALPIAILAQGLAALCLSSKLTGGDPHHASMEHLVRCILAEVTDLPVPLLAKLLRSSQMCVTRWFSPSACWQGVVDETFGKGTIPALHAAAVALHIGHHAEGVTNTAQAAGVRARAVLPEHVRAVVAELPNLARSLERKKEEVRCASAIASSPILHELVSTAGRLPSWEQSITRMLQLLGMSATGSGHAFEDTMQDIKRLLFAAYQPVLASLQKKLVSELAEAWAAPSAHDLVMVAANASASTQRIPVSTLSEAVWQSCYDASSPASALDSCALAFESLGRVLGGSTEGYQPENPHEPARSRSTLEANVEDSTAADGVPADTLASVAAMLKPSGQHGPVQALERTSSGLGTGSDSAGSHPDETGQSILHQHEQLSVTLYLPICLSSKDTESDGVNPSEVAASRSIALPVHSSPCGRNGSSRNGVPPSKLPATTHHESHLEGMLPLQMLYQPASAAASASGGALCTGQGSAERGGAPSLELAAAPAASKESESAPSPCARVGGCKRSMDSPQASSADEPAKRRRPLRPSPRCQRSAELLLHVCAELGTSSVLTESPTTLVHSPSHEG